VSLDPDVREGRRSLQPSSIVLDESCGEGEETKEVDDDDDDDKGVGS
jgi:hypothetical protein